MDRDVAAWLRQQLQEAHPDLLREMLATMVQELMGAEAQQLCGADYGERSSERSNSRNGYRERDWDTRVGSITLAIPKLRQGSYFPDWLLEPRRRAERALVSVIAQAYLAGVSTRRVEGLVQTLGIAHLSKSQVSVMAKSLDGLVDEFRNRPLDASPYTYVWVDALTQRCREGGRVVNVCTAIATGVNADGQREILGVDVFTAEDGAAWTSFLRGLVAPAGCLACAWSSPMTTSVSSRPSRQCYREPAGSAAEFTFFETCSPGYPRRPRPWWPRWSARSSPSPTRRRSGLSTSAWSSSCRSASLKPPPCSPKLDPTCSPSPPFPASTGA
jgi:hypothetical protein